MDYDHVTDAETIKREMIELLPRLRAFARALTKDATRADDLVQIGCEKALRHLDGYTPGTRLDAWLFRILRNAWIDQHRAERHLRLSTDISDHEIADPVGDHAEARLELQAVQRAMAALAPDQREVLQLIGIEGMRYRDAAEALALPLGTVMSRLARGRRALHDLLVPQAAAPTRKTER